MSPGRNEGPGVTSGRLAAARRSASHPTKARASNTTMKIMRKVATNNIDVFYTLGCRRPAMCLECGLLATSQKIIGQKLNVCHCACTITSREMTGSEIGRQSCHQDVHRPGHVSFRFRLDRHRARSFRRNNDMPCEHVARSVLNHRTRAGGNRAC